MISCYLIEQFHRKELRFVIPAQAGIQETRTPGKIAQPLDTCFLRHDERLRSKSHLGVNSTPTDK